MKKVICNFCNKEITSKTNLAVAASGYFYLVKPYHHKCFVQIKNNHLFEVWHVNTKISTYVTILSFIVLVAGLVIYLLYKSDEINISIVLIFLICGGIFVYPRLASYFKYEKYLP